MRKLLKKKLSIFILSFVIFSFIFVNYASASVSVIVSNITSDSVKLNATGLTASSVYVFILDDDTHDSANHNYDIYTVGSTDTTASTTFTSLNLTPGKEYTASLYSDDDWDYTHNSLYANPNLLALVNFNALVTFTATSTYDSSSGTYSAVLSAAGLNAGKMYNFQIKDDNMLHSDTEAAKNDGTFTHTFTELSLTPNVNYTASVWDMDNVKVSLASTTFTAPGSATLAYSASSLVYESGLGTYSINLNATKLTPGNQYIFEIIDDKNTITSDTQEVGSDGSLTYSFDDLNLTAGQSYTASIYNIDDKSTPLASVGFIAPKGADNNSNNNNIGPHTVTVGSLVPCGTQRYPAGTYQKVDGSTCGDPKVAGCTDVSGQVTKANMCTFNDLLILVNNLVKFVFVALVVPIAAISFAYAGFLLISSGGETSKREKAKKIFWGVVWGLVIAAAAWLIVHVVLTILGFSGNAFGL